MPEWIATRAFRSTTRERGRSGRSATRSSNDELALLWMVNMGCIDMNTWYSRVDRPERPDFVPLRPRPLARRRLPRERRRSRSSSRSSSTRSGSRAARRRAARTGSTCSSRSQRRHTYADTREFAEIVAARSTRAHRGARHDRVVEGEAARRAHRREPERRGQDDRLRLLGAAARRARPSRRRFAGTR